MNDLRFLVQTRFLLFFGLTIVFGCTSSRVKDDEYYSSLYSGQIAYPFTSRTQPISKNLPREKLVIKSAVGNREYSIEIPGEARDFDVEVPLADLKSSDPADVGPDGPDNLANPSPADREVISALPKLDRNRSGDLALMDKAFGVGSKDGPGQAPSYLVGLAKVNGHFKNRNFEYALIEINSLLSFYPTSTLLHKMKGTVYLKLNNFDLALKAWNRALELQPDDAVLKKGIERLQSKMAAQSGRGAMSQNTSTPPAFSNGSVDGPSSTARPRPDSPDTTNMNGLLQ